MKNIEKFSKEISHLVNKGSSLECSIATVAGIREEKPCYHQECEECHKKCLEWMYSEQPILTNDEKYIVEEMIDVVMKFGCEVNYVYKSECGNGDSYIWIRYENASKKYDYMIESPRFNNDMFKGMEMNKEYTIEELGITCQTQKDNYVRQ